MVLRRVQARFPARPNWQPLTTMTQPGYQGYMLIRTWRGKRTLKQAAAIIGLPVTTYHDIERGGWALPEQIVQIEAATNGRVRAKDLLTAWAEKNRPRARAAAARGSNARRHYQRKKEDKHG